MNQNKNNEIVQVQIIRGNVLIFFYFTNAIWEKWSISEQLCAQLTSYSDPLRATHTHVVLLTRLLLFNAISFLCFQLQTNWAKFRRYFSE